VDAAGQVQVAGLAKTNAEALEVEMAHFVKAIKGEK
jgi:hypothetical protein